MHCEDEAAWQQRTCKHRWHGGSGIQVWIAASMKLATHRRAQNSTWNTICKRGMKRWRRKSRKSSWASLARARLPFLSVYDTAQSANVETRKKHCRLRFCLRPSFDHLSPFFSGLGGSSHAMLCLVRPDSFRVTCNGK
eukprot:6349377-Amphidinium_carterae.1